MSTKSDKTIGDDYDDRGWTPIHHAAHEGYFKTVSKILDTKPSQLDVETLDKLQVTPLWLAFSTGKIETVSTLLFYNANVRVTDTRNIGVIEIAIRNKHTKVIQHLFSRHPELGETVWKHLAEYTTLDCLHDADGPSLLSSTLNITLVISREAKMITQIKQNGIFSKVISLYKPDIISQHVWIEGLVLEILQNVCQSSSASVEKEEVSTLLNVLPSRLGASDENTVFQVILILMRLFLKFDYFKELMTQGGRFAFLITFLKKSEPKEALKIEALFIIRRSIQHDHNRQNYFHENGLLPLLVQFSNESESEQFRVDCIKTMRRLLEGNDNIQSQLLKFQIFESLRRILELKTKPAVKEVCKLISATATANPEIQGYYIRSGAVGHLSKFFKTFKEDAMHEWIIRGLWGIGGEQHDQKLLVAKSIESKLVVALVTSNSSQTLQFYGSEILRVLMRIGDRCLHASRETIMLHLVNYLKSVAVTSENLLTTFKTMQCLCTYRGYRPNKTIQQLAIEKNAMQVLHQVASKSDNPCVELESIETIATILMGNPKEIAILKKEIGLPLKNIITRYVNHEDPIIRSKVCHVIGFIVLTNDHREVLRQHFHLPLSYFEILLEDETIPRAYTRVNTAFQLVSLRDIITDSTPVETTMKGIEILRTSLDHSSSEIVAMAADYISGLSQYCSGLRAAFNSAGFMEKLCDLLFHDDETIKTAVSVTIAILARGLKGEIILLKRCRKEGAVIELIKKWIQFITLPTHFMERWLHYKTLKSEN